MLQQSVWSRQTQVGDQEQQYVAAEICQALSTQFHTKLLVHIGQNHLLCYLDPWACADSPLLCLSVHTVPNVSQKWTDIFAMMQNDETTFGQWARDVQSTVTQYSSPIPGLCTSSICKISSTHSCDVHSNLAKFITYRYKLCVNLLPLGTNCVHVLPTHQTDVCRYTCECVTLVQCEAP